MKEYSSDQIRNVAVVSHDGAGKTALVESLLLTSGAVDFVVELFLPFLTNWLIVGISSPPEIYLSI